MEKSIFAALFVSMLAPTGCSTVHQRYSGFEDEYVTFHHSPTSACSAISDGKPQSTVSADFDGDKKLDVAKIARAPSESAEGLYVWLSSMPTGSPIKLLKFGVGMADDMVVSVAGAGSEIDTACARGYKPCSGGEPLKVKLENAGIWLTKCESAASFFVWDKRKQNFVRHWYSD